MARLTLRYEYSEDGDSFGRLRLTVETTDFFGSGGFWVQWQELVEFAESLASYPLVPPATPWRWGYDTLEGDDVIIALSVESVGRRGKLLVTVEIADDFFPKRRLRTQFTTDYASLGAFRTALLEVMRREAEMAVLVGEEQ